MKGIVFTEFLEMVEKEFGYDTVDEIIEASDLPSDGVYTAVGTYDHGEMVTLVTQLSEKTKIPVPDLLKAYGKYIFHTFLAGYPAFFERAINTFDFLESIDNHIHVEVKKLYPDAELPEFSSNRVTDDHMEMIYTSKRKMSALAEGLIEETLIHFKDDCDVVLDYLDEEGSIVKFTITRKK